MINVHWSRGGEHHICSW